MVVAQYGLDAVDVLRPHRSEGSHVGTQADLIFFCVQNVVVEVHDRFLYGNLLVVHVDLRFVEAVDEVDAVQNHLGILQLEFEDVVVGVPRFDALVLLSELLVLSVPGFRFSFFRFFVDQHLCERRYSPAN